MHCGIAADPFTVNVIPVQIKRTCYTGYSCLCPTFINFCGICEPMKHHIPGTEFLIHISLEVKCLTVKSSFSESSACYHIQFFFRDLCHFVFLLLRATGPVPFVDYVITWEISQICHTTLDDLFADEHHQSGKAPADLADALSFYSLFVKVRSGITSTEILHQIQESAVSVLVNKRCGIYL